MCREVLAKVMVISYFASGPKKKGFWDVKKHNLLEALWTLGFHLSHTGDRFLVYKDLTACTLQPETS
jgi:hypothetical protein